ncbi:hypothetical protein JHK82_052975 [Glycine max]|uniref:Uncharacterized protein n=1 Tax=Glycine max TaxID=3847 RepID=A0A0R0EW78_SOYBN|nr:hypothetical protein JHK86_052819 [Glycine max]KAG4927191.1 hypothetical protein JHK85_053677 [Glycine max]KAG5082810.1 hypothetical protein JHK84_052848 [Glycine max]KAG5085578.1 hypothetical protein JHK82_052975 [Glycine max]KRG94420.1 hypothetical protein GLYMA_19G083300v4 [Glycine max]
MVLCRELMGWNTFISDEVTVSHGFGNMIDDSQNDFYHPNHTDEMSADHNGLGNHNEDPFNGLGIDPLPNLITLIFPIISRLMRSKNERKIYGVLGCENGGKYK